MATKAGKISKRSDKPISLRQGEQFFRSLIEKSFDAIVVLDLQGKVQYASPSTQRLLGYSAEELVGRYAFDLIHPDDLEQTLGLFSNLLQAPDTRLTIEFRVLHKDGSIRWMEGTGTNLLDDPNVEAIVANYHDISERKQAEERQRLLNEASNMLASSLDQQITLHEIAQIIVPTLADYCRIAVLDDNQQIKEISVNHIDPEKITLVRALYEQYKDRTDTTHGLQRLLETGKPELISNVSGSILAPVQDNPELLTIVHTLGLQSYMGVPLIARGKTIGAITFSSVQPHRRYTTNDLLFAQDLARLVALTLDNARLYQKAQDEIAERRQIENNLLFLSEASKILAASLDHQTTFANIARLAVPHIADWCSVDMRTEHGIQQLALAHVDPEKMQWAQELSQKNPPDPNARSGIPNVLRTGKPAFNPNISDDVLVAAARDEEELALMRILGITSAMIVPLLVRGNASGAITFVTAESGRHYTPADLSMAEELASRAALAIENAHLYTEAQNAIGIRDEFISIASHELRTPITSLKVYTQVLQKQFAKRGEENLSRFLAKMDAQLNKLTLLIGDLLNVTKIELGQLAFHEEAFDLNELVTETVEQIQMTTPKHTISIGGNIPQPVWGDVDRIGQVLTNLLSNAVKYSPQADSIIVRLTSEQDSAVVSIQDFGIGIDREHQGNIFNRFYRVSNPEEKTYPGLGIGLYISHEIIKRHGGDLTVVSEKGKGSLFRFTLPYTRGTRLTL
ncbi:MAG TPA: PAS domain S-box protein [Ktedonobacteraceae bacterium]|nr:PAS domain S-box protein [Ktedonobacteraceae bacterium]